MTHITCNKCKNADLIFENGELRCPSCGAVFGAESESLLLGITLYNENKKEECENALMKALVKDGGSCEALLYKALSEALCLDEDTVSFTDIYSRILSAFKTADDCDFPRLLAIANDEMAKHERALTELHVKAFETADAEKIKKEVESILKIRDEALTFRNDLTQLVAEFNGRNESVITLNLSRGFYVSYELADEVGDKKLNKIKDDIASHTVFTGILSSDIKNLEIYYRCVVMFFEKSKAKYDFLISNAKKLAYLNGALESGKYASVASPAVAAEKLKAAAYNFFEESLKEYDDENEGKPSVIVTAPEKPEVEITAEVEIELEATPETEINEDSEEAVEDAEASEAEAEAEEESTEEAVEVTADEADAYSEETEKSSKENEAEEIFSAEESEEPELEISFEVEIETTPEAPKAEEAEDGPATYDVQEAEEAENVNAEEVTGAASSSAEVISAIDLATQKVMDEISAQGDEAVAEITKEPEEIISNSLSAVAAKHEASKLTEAEHENKPEEEKAIEGSESPENEEQKETGAPEKTAEEEPSAENEEKPEELETTLKPKKKKHIGLIVFLLIIAAVLAFSGIKYIPGIISEVKYKSATTLLEDGSYAKAEEAFKALGEYKDSEDKAKESVYLSADSLCKSDDHNAAAEIFASLGEYKDAVTRVLSCKYDSAVKTLNDGNFDNAAKLFEEIKDYGNSEEMINECTYKKASALLEEKSYTDAAELFASLGKYSDSPEKANEAKYQYVTENLSKDNKTTVAYITELAKAKYRNSAELKTKLLGEEKTDSVKLFVNTSADDLSTALKSAAHTSELYFHIVCGEAYYGKSLTLSYTTQYGYTQSNTVTVSKNNSDDYITYPASNVSGYTVTFNAYDENGTSLGKVNFTIE